MTASQPLHERLGGATRPGPRALPSMTLRLLSHPASHRGLGGRTHWSCDRTRAVYAPTLIVPWAGISSRPGPDAQNSVLGCPPKAGLYPSQSLFSRTRQSPARGRPNVYAGYLRWLMFATT